MPLSIKKVNDKWRLIGPDGKIEKNKEGNPVDGGGHSSKEGAIKQMQAININKAEGEIPTPITIIYDDGKFKLFVNGQELDYSDLYLSSYRYSDGEDDTCLSFSFQKDVGGGLVESKTFRLKPKVNNVNKY